MKPVKFHKDFDKRFAKRIHKNKKLLVQFDERFTLWLGGERDEPLFDHGLTGKLKGKRAFSVTGDIRVVYKETTEAYIFLDIGSHDQVY